MKMTGFNYVILHCVERTKAGKVPVVGLAPAVLCHPKAKVDALWGQIPFGPSSYPRKPANNSFSTRFMNSYKLFYRPKSG